MSLELHTYDRLNWLVDTDTLGLRDYAWKATREIELLREEKVRQADTITVLDRANADLAGRLQTAEEQLAAATLEGKP